MRESRLPSSLPAADLLKSRHARLVIRDRVLGDPASAGVLEEVRARVRARVQVGHERACERQARRRLAEPRRVHLEFRSGGPIKKLLAMRCCAREEQPWIFTEPHRNRAHHPRLLRCVAVEVREGSHVVAEDAEVRGREVGGVG